MSVRARRLRSQASAFSSHSPTPQRLLRLRCHFSKFGRVYLTIPHGYCPSGMRGLPRSRRTGRPLRDRRARLEPIVGGSELVLPVRRLARNGFEAWSEVIARDYEGLVAKEETSLYEAGPTRRSGRTSPRHRSPAVRTRRAGGHTAIYHSPQRARPPAILFSTAGRGPSPSSAALYPRAMWICRGVIRLEITKSGRRCGRTERSRP